MKHSRILLAAVLCLAASSITLHASDPSPIPVSGLGLWLKADAGVTRDGANVVCAWADQSGNGNDLATAAGQPAFDPNAASSLPAVKFNGANDVMWASRLVINGAGPFTTFSCVKCSALSPQTVFWQGNSFGTGAYGVFSLGNYWTGQLGLIGDVGEILIYNRNLTDEERLSIESYLSSRWGSVTKARVADAKALSDGAVVGLTSPKVATVASGTYSDGCAYLEDTDRSSGIKVKGATLALWENVTATGTLTTDANGERVLNISSVDSRAPGTEIGALGMPNRSICASGLLVRVWGRVTEKTAAHLILDDGSGTPVSVELDALCTPISVLPNVGDYAEATGHARCLAGGARVVRVRSSADIRVY